MPLRMQTFDSNGPDVRIRGSAYQVHEKYLQLARDAASSGDRIIAESYLQHAEHYYRIIAAVQEQQQNQNPNDPQRRYRPDGQGYGQDYRGHPGDEMNGEGGEDYGDEFGENGQQPRMDQAYRPQPDVGGYRQQNDGQYRGQQDGYGRQQDDGQRRTQPETAYRTQASSEATPSEFEGGDNPQPDRPRQWDLNGRQDGEAPSPEPAAPQPAGVNAAPEQPRRGRLPRRERQQQPTLPDLGGDSEPSLDS